MQGQGKVRDFYKKSGKIFDIVKVREFYFPCEKLRGFENIDRNIDGPAKKCRSNVHVDFFLNYKTLKARSVEIVERSGLSQGASVLKRS